MNLNRKLMLNGEIQLDFCDVRIAPRFSDNGVDITSRGQTKIDTVIAGIGKELFGTPIIASNMDGVGTISMAKVLSHMGLFTALTKHVDYDSEECVSLFQQENSKVFYSIGMSDDELLRMSDYFKKIGVSNPNINIDVANGYMKKFQSFIKTCRTLFPKSYIMAGNVVDYGAAYSLVENGADIVKVGIGSGSACTTRIVAGVGRPQLSAVLECSSGTFDVCSDGGCVNYGDISVAFAAGAKMVMLGGMLAGHTESELDIIENGEKKFVQFYGMSSFTAMKKHGSELRNYRSSEGRNMLIPYKGDVEHTIQNLLGGLRSSLTYNNSQDLDDFCKTARFYRVGKVINEAYAKFDVSESRK
jgi:GMP reductase